MTLAQTLQNKPHLVWYITDPSALSEASQLEHILNYGDWEDFKTAENSLGSSRLKELFLSITSKKRCNLRPETKNYFSAYFNRYA